MSNPLPPKADSELDAMILNEVQVLLSEKRTSLSTMRTGIAVFAFPLSVLSILIATSGSYQLQEVIAMAGAIAAAESGPHRAGGLPDHARLPADSSLRPAD